MSARPRRVSAPERISSAHDVASFSCGRESLDLWLKKRALSNNGRTSQTFVVTVESQVVGYYCLAAGSVSLREAPSAMRRNSIDPIPVVLLGRLAVDDACKGMGLGADLLRDAILRSLMIAKEVGVRALLVHALDDKASAFYSHHGFIVSPISPLVLMLPLDCAAALL